MLKDTFLLTNSMSKQTKTNAVRLLEKAGLKFETVPYPVDEEHLDAQHVADALGEDVNMVFKTLVLHGDRNGYFVCVIPGNCEVDLKKAASVSGNKKAEMIPMKELLPTTGYIRGGCSPIGMKKPFPTFFHSTATDFGHIYVSAGMRGLQIKIDPNALIEAARGSLANITK